MSKTNKPSGGWKDRRGSASSRGYGAPWRRKREAALARDMGLCQPCLRRGRTTAAQAVDHIKGKATTDAEEMITSSMCERMHQDDLRNLQSICNACHAEKTSREGNGGRKTPEIGDDGWPV